MSIAELPLRRCGLFLAEFVPHCVRARTQVRHLRADGGVEAALCDTVNRWGRAGPSVYSAGSLMSIAVDCSWKGRAICQRCHKKGGSTLERSLASPASHTHTLALIFQPFTFCSSSRDHLSSDWPWSVILFREWRTGRELPKLSPCVWPTQEPGAPNGLLSCLLQCAAECYDAELMTGRLVQTVWTGGEFEARPLRNVQLWPLHLDLWRFISW